MDTQSGLFEQSQSLFQQSNGQGFTESVVYNTENNEVKKFPNVINLGGDVVPCKPCQIFGLDPSKLQDEELMKHRGYKRLYNIVANDLTPSNQVFRPNLIKQLFFMLKITPFIHYSLRNSFLNKVEEWYNSNDYKKIKLAKSLDNFVRNVLKKAQGSRPQSSVNSRVQTAKTIARPKTGVEWDRTLNPFLRPYTAKIKKNNGQINGKYRPESSKVGLVSTNAQTMNPNQDDVGLETVDAQESINDIEEEWERSQDFRNKFRTLHPEEEPTYEKLMSLINKVASPSNSEFVRTGDNSKKTNLSNARSPFNKRNIQSAAAKLNRETSNARLVAERELKQSNSAFQHDHGQFDDFGKESQGEEIVEEDNQSQGDALSQNITNKTGIYKSDSRINRGRKLMGQKSPNHLYSNVNGVKVVRPYTAKESNIINKLDQYSSLEKNKRVIQSIDDQECVDQFRSYIRNKTKMKKQMSRKSESKRYMNNFTNCVKIVPLKSANLGNSSAGSLATSQNPTNNAVDQKAPIIEEANSDKIIEEKQTNIIQLVDPFAPESPQFLKYPTYNVKEYFSETSKKSIVNSYRGVKNFQIEPHLQNPANLTKMTSPQRLWKQQKFDPMHPSNIATYNNETLQQIEKIKEKLGGKFSASTDSLMRALFIGERTDQDKSLGFQIPERNYLMVPRGDKKKKKRKLRKGISKSKPKSLSKGKGRK